MNGVALFGARSNESKPFWLRPNVWIVILLALSCSLSILSCGIGAMAIAPERLLKVLLEPFFQSGEVTQIESTVLLQIRLPRTMLTILIGLGLGVSGAAMQGLMRNPLADPGLLGLTMGASLMAALVIVLGNQLLPESLAIYKQHALPFFAFLGSFAVSLTVMKLGVVAGKTQISMLLLAGLAINGLVGTALGLLTFMADEQELRSLTFWSMGSVSHGSWDDIFVLFPILTLGCYMLLRCARDINAMVLGDDQAKCLGVSVEKLKKRIVIWISLSVGSAVALTGAIGFIGLMAPHIVRMSLGPDNRYLLPLSGLTGSSLLLVSDILARTLMAPGELPIGIITSALGSPLFIYLLIKGKFGIGSI